MKRPFVSLRPEITRTHAMFLMHWLDDERVTRYLSDSRSVSRFIQQAVDRTQMPILTHLFNQGGRFFMVYDREDTPLGFVRLVKSGPECEIVLVIGDHDYWGQGIGSSTILQGLKHAFLAMRAQTVIAKIHPDNRRSLKAFERCGFTVLRETPTLKCLSLTADRYRRLLRDGVLARAAEIYITEMDQSRLQEIIDLEDAHAIFELEHEIERAVVVAPQRVADDVVTMNSRLVLRLDDEERAVSLVYPKDADEASGRLSVLSDLGAAIIGSRRGDAIEWVVSDRTRRIRIDRLIYQPESASHFHL
jgi:regulator of nucleoside diphosphate kinase